MGRRPIATRNARWAQAAARRLADSSITPNQISIASMGAAAIAGAAFWAAGSADGLAHAVLLLLAAAGCQVRLMCNLLDGLVAMEGGKRQPTGAFWNECPDRVADILILAGVGLGVADPALGFAAACMAVFTAYVRELGRASGAPPDFRGPMAKPQRMAAVTAAAMLTLGEPLLPWTAGTILTATLWIVTIGAAITVVRRSVALLRWMNNERS